MQQVVRNDRIQERLNLDSFDDPRLLTAIWNWLPAFRVMAEVEHLPTASRRLHVGASSLSRTLGLLESACGRPLFNRHGRRLILNTAGQALLRTVQAAMHAMQSGLGRLREEPMSGPLRVASLGVLTNHYVLPALLALQGAHADLVPSLSNLRPVEANPALLNERLDVAFYYDAVAPGELVLTPLGESSASVYCGQGHPLYASARPSLRQVQSYAFSVPEVGDRGVSMDGWPVELPRKVGLQISLLLTNLDVALSGRLLTVLPDVIALPHRRDRRLRRLPLDVIPPTALFAAHRRTHHRCLSLVAPSASACCPSPPPPPPPAPSYPA